jgi:hypothetical protein
VTLIEVGALLVVVAMIAGHIPAWKASRIDPMVAFAVELREANERVRQDADTRPSNEDYVRWVEEYPVDANPL